MDIQKLLRPHLLELKPYSSARDDFSGEAEVYLDANENALGSTSKDHYRRYPDPYQKKLKEQIAKIKKIDPERIFLGNGSDEPIDLLFRAFCNPGKDSVIITPPTYGMYEVSANINDVKVRSVKLTTDYGLDMPALLQAIEPGVKMIFLCSPNNPTGTCLDQDDILQIAEKFQGLVVLDEAYIDFSRHKSLLSQLDEFDNLVILQTFSKAWGLASLRLGMAFASPEIIKILNMIKPPYNISGATQELAFEALNNLDRKEEMVKSILSKREDLVGSLAQIPWVERIHPSDANFVLVKMPDARAKYQTLISDGIIVRDRSNVALCEDCLRITVGTDEENAKLIDALKRIAE